ncbi:DgyrCDS14006 [Dimorphilus gyrociliatus]|uniref:DgyrCDS14006 n=1 Tax=Dimorphilus gyrociliatus TaxID=2664684 RepID=A0A7I8WCD1_9ANNE|nr:DgyrCDS14006 [Dimorphilus gyrociliatus]
MGIKGRELSNVAQCVRYFLLVTNLIFAMAGAAMIGVGIWLVVDRDFLTPLVEIDLFRAGLYMVLVCGVVIFAVFFLGCLGAMMLKKIFLIIYFIALLIITCVLFVAAILAIVMRTKLRDEIKNTMMHNLKKRYGVDLHIAKNKAVTYGFDRAQEYLRCCAVDDNGWGNYRESDWWRQQPGQVGNAKVYVPKSCCYKVAGEDYNSDDLKKCQTPDGGGAERVNVPSSCCAVILYTGRYVNKQKCQTYQNKALPAGARENYTYYHDKNRPRVPESCCYVDLYKDTILDKEKCQTYQFGPPTKPGGSSNPMVYHKGCYSRAVEFLKEHVIFIIGFGFGVAIALISGMVFSLILYCSLEY